jgi:hypothetical protein
MNPAAPVTTHFISADSFEQEEEMVHGLRTRTACADYNGSERRKGKRQEDRASRGLSFFHPLLSDPWRSVHAVRVPDLSQMGAPWGLGCDSSG